MTPAPLQIIDYWATSIRMDACPDYDSKTATKIDFDSITVKHSVKPIDSPDPEKTGTRWLVELSIKQAPCASANIPYTFGVSLQGIILALPGLTGERLDRVIRANGPALLFGSAREMIRAATGRGPHDAVIIPSTNFLPPAAAAPAPAGEGDIKRGPAKKAAKKPPRKRAGK